MSLLSGEILPLASTDCYDNREPGRTRKMKVRLDGWSNDQIIEVAISSQVRWSDTIDRIEGYTYLKGSKWVVTALVDTTCDKADRGLVELKQIGADNR